MSAPGRASFEELDGLLEDGAIGVRVAAVHDDPDRRTLIVDLAVRRGTAGSTVRVTGHGVRQWALGSGGAGPGSGAPGRLPGVPFLQVGTDHPVLRTWTEQAATLYFRGVPAAPEALAHRVLQQARSSTGGLLPLDDLLNSHAGDLAGLLARGRGLLATGPRGVVEDLAAVVDRAGVGADVLVDGPDVPRERRRRELPRLVALELGTAGYVVAERFAVDGTLPAG